MMVMVMVMEMVVVVRRKILQEDTALSNFDCGNHHSLLGPLLIPLLARIHELINMDRMPNTASASWCRWERRGFIQKSNA